MFDFQNMLLEYMTNQFTSNYILIQSKNIFLLPIIAGFNELSRTFAKDIVSINCQLVYF